MKSKTCYVERLMEKMFSRLGEVGCLSKDILVPLAPDSRAVRTTNGIVHNLDRNTERSYSFFSCAVSLSQLHKISESSRNTE